MVKLSDAVSLFLWTIFCVIVGGAPFAGTEWSFLEKMFFVAYVCAIYAIGLMSCPWKETDE